MGNIFIVQISQSKNYLGDPVGCFVLVDKSLILDDLSQSWVWHVLLHYLQVGVTVECFEIRNEVRMLEQRLRLYFLAEGLQRIHLLL